MKRGATAETRSDEASTPAITIKSVTSEDGFRRCQDILIEVWDLEQGGQRNIIPTRLFNISHHCGGVVLAAHDQAGEMVGFVWAFPALDAEGNVLLFSDTLAVLARYRDRGIGCSLKFAQREWALQHNISLIRWTYDPLEARNGYMNIARLGSVAFNYRRNLYGVGITGPNIGIETDRFISDWYLNSARARQCASNRRKTTAPPDLPVCIETKNCEGEILPQRIRLDLAEPELLLPLPPDFQGLKQSSLALANEWRLAVRSACEEYFARGYAVIDFHVEILNGQRHGFYRLAQNRPACLARSQFPSNGR